MAWREVDGFESRIDSMKWPQGQDSVLWDNIAGDDDMELVREGSSGGGNDLNFRRASSRYL